MLSLTIGHKTRTTDLIKVGCTSQSFGWFEEQQQMTGIAQQPQGWITRGPVYYLGIIKN